jgi:hypothetical protein
MGAAAGGVRMMPLEALRSIIVKAALEARARISFHDGETADRLRGPDGERRIARMVAAWMSEVADHEIELAPDDRKSHTMAAVRKALPRLRGA